MTAFILPANDPAAIEAAIEHLRAGQVIVIPTDTVYGIACDSLNPEAIARLYEIKGRAAQKALPLLCADEAQLRDVVRAVSPLAERLIAQFMPGGLTVVLPAQPHLPPILTSGGDTIAVRIPDHPSVRRVAAGIGYPLAVSSANRSGESECYTAAEVAAQLGEDIPLILDGGAIPPTNLASTVLNLTVTPPQLLREGAIRYETLRDMIPSLTRA